MATSADKRVEMVFFPMQLPTAQSKFELKIEPFRYLSVQFGNGLIPWSRLFSGMTTNEK